MPIQSKSLQVLCVALVSLTSVQAYAQSRPAQSVQNVDLGVLIEQVARQTGKTFIVDPRVRASVTILGSEAANVGYDELLDILDVHGFAAISSGRFVRIVPSAEFRSQAVPTIAGNRRFADGEIVNKVIPIKNTSAVHLVPILRPLLPQSAHMAASACTNSLLIVDRYANVQRIAGIIEALDKGETFTPAPCVPAETRKE